MTALPWHQQAWQRLQARRERNAMPHALLLAGAAGLGKRAFATRLVRSLLCTEPVDGEACGHCRACQLLAANTHPDHLILTYGLNSNNKPRKEIVVSQVRELSQRLAMASQFGGWQTATVDPADGMNTAAANALLKTLEEPSAASFLLLVADAPWRLPATVRSRCQRIDFQLPTREEALAWLAENDIDDAEAALDAAGGNPGLARDWARDGLLAERRQVQQELAAIAQGKQSRQTIMRRWIDDDGLGQRLWFAAQVVAADTRARAAGERECLGSRLQPEALGQWFDAANRARDALRGPLRRDLLVLDLLAQWR